MGSSDTALSAEQERLTPAPCWSKGVDLFHLLLPKETRPFWWERAGSVGSRYATWLLAFSTKMVKPFQTKRHSACSLPARVISICVRSRWQGMRAEQMPGTTSARLNAHLIPSAVLHSAPTMPSIPNGTDRWTSDDELAMDF
jgi:hypothetical protein